MQFRIDTSNRQPIYLQLVQQVREGVARGISETGEKLPSVRQLSRELLVNPNTIARAYTELEREGVLIGRQGLGLFVAESQKRAD
jgi:GntR family transcriptional regulator